jgi:hypothetical protein
LTIKKKKKRNYCSLKEKREKRIQFVVEGKEKRKKGFHIPKVPFIIP